MSVSEFFTETIMNSRLNPVLSGVALGLVGAGIEYYREENVEQKILSAIIGGSTYWHIGSLGIIAYRAYKDFNMYESGITALCGVAGAYLAYNFFAKIERSDTKKLASDGQSIVMGITIGISLGYFVISRMNQEALYR